MKILITRCALVDGTPHPDEPEKVVTPFVDSKGNDAEHSTYPGGAVSYHPGPHYEVEADVLDAKGKRFAKVTREFEASYPVGEIPNAMLQTALDQYGGQRLEGLEVTSG